MYEYEFYNAIEQLKKLGIPLYDVHLYDGDNVTHNGSDVELLCVVPKKALRKRLRIALLDVWRVRKTLHFERKMVRLYISSKQSDNVINESKSRRRMINSLFNDFYSTYKYSYRMQTILELNKEAILKALKTPKTCENCALFDADDMICNHEDVPEFDVPLYINKSGCGLHKLKDH